MNSKTKSNKTTTAGVFSILMAALIALVYAIDGNPNTVADWSQVLAMLGIGGGFLAARDNDK